MSGQVRPSRPVRAWAVGQLCLFAVSKGGAKPRWPNAAAQWASSAGESTDFGEFVRTTRDAVRVNQLHASEFDAFVSDPDTLVAGLRVKG